MDETVIHKVVKGGNPGNPGGTETLQAIKDLKTTLSGLSVETTVAVDISGQILRAEQYGIWPVKVSGETIIAKISGETIVSEADVSGQIIRAEQYGDWAVKVSGEVVRVSGETMRAIALSGGILPIHVVSGEVIGKVSGEVINIQVPTQIKTWLTRTISALSGGDVLHSGAVKSVLIKSLAASGPHYIGGATDMPYSGKGFLIVSGEAIDVNVNNFNAVRIFSSTSGQQLTFLGID